MILWFEFIICIAVIIYAGSRLSVCGDVIAEKTGFGRTLVGLVLLSFTTSLPELVIGISSVTYVGVPDIAVGDVIGSCVFNLFILAILDSLYRPAPLLVKADPGNILSGGFAVVLIGIVTVSLFLGKTISPLGWVGPYTFLFIGVYFIAIKLIYYYERKEMSKHKEEAAVEIKYKGISFKKAIRSYIINALIVISAAVFLPKIGKGIAEMTGLGQTFVGNIFIAMSTSLPEIVVSVAALRIGAIDLAVGNVFGSNIFNILILAIDDLLFVKGPIFSFVSPNHIISAVVAIVMSAVAIIGLTYHSGKKPLPLSWNSLVLVILYIINLTLLYVMK